jgi:hypothetical protein
MTCQRRIFSFLHGHTLVLQIFDSAAESFLEHLRPPYIGLRQFLVLVIFPELQNSEQALHSPQSPKVPSTERKPKSAFFSHRFQDQWFKIVLFAYGSKNFTLIWMKQIELIWTELS